MIEKIKEKWLNVKQGNVNCIPFDLPELSKYIPGIMKGIPVIVTAGTGVDTCPCI